MANKAPSNTNADEVKVLARNRRARHEYHVDETLEAGVVLAGSEVKSIRAGKATLVDAFADIDRGEAWLHQVDIGTTIRAASGSFCCTAARSIAWRARSAKKATRWCRSACTRRRAA